MATLKKGRIRGLNKGGENEKGKRRDNCWKGKIIKEVLNEQKKISDHEVCTICFHNAVEYI